MFTNSRNISPMHTVIRSSSPCKHAIGPCSVSSGEALPRACLQSYQHELLQDQLSARLKVELGSPFPVKRQFLQVWGESVPGEGKESWSNCLLFHMQRAVCSPPVVSASSSEQGLEGHSELLSQEGVLCPCWWGRKAPCARQGASVEAAIHSCRAGSSLHCLAPQIV